MNSTPQEKVVKCKNEKCGLHFMYTEKSIKCPFCHTKYGEVKKEENMDKKRGNKPR
jgi:Zn finger protein HypA/HybF involved in hydrogenase expression